VQTATPARVVRPKGARGGEEHEGLQGEQGTNPSAEAALIWILALIRAVSSKQGTVACSPAILAAGRRQKGLGRNMAEMQLLQFLARPPGSGIKPLLPQVSCRADDEAIDTGRLHTMEDTPPRATLRSSADDQAPASKHPSRISGFPGAPKIFGFETVFQYENIFDSKKIECCSVHCAA